LNRADSGDYRYAITNSIAIIRLADKSYSQTAWINPVCLRYLGRGCIRGFSDEQKRSKGISTYRLGRQLIVLQRAKIQDDEKQCDLEQQPEPNEFEHDRP
jgi:hypothetical protein